MLYIDPREGSKELVEPLSRMGLPVRVERMEYGDVSFVGSGPDGPIGIGIEYKTVGDLLSSWHDGRLLGHQLPGMLNSYSIVYLLIEGSISGDSEDGIREWGRRGWSTIRSQTKYSTLMGWLQTIRTLYGVHVLTTANLLTTAVQVAAIYKWWEKPYASHGSPVEIHTPDLRRGLLSPTRIMKVAHTFPGVGLEKLPDIEEKFGSIREMVNADAAEWMTVPGIGRKTAQGIVNYVEIK